MITTTGKILSEAVKAIGRLKQAGVNPERYIRMDEVYRLVKESARPNSWFMKIFTARYIKK